MRQRSSSPASRDRARTCRRTGSSGEKNIPNVCETPDFCIVVGGDRCECGRFDAIERAAQSKLDVS